MPSPRRRKAAEYRDRDLAVLHFLHRYGVVVGAMISRALFGGKEAGHVLRRFSDKNWCMLYASALPGGISYVTLTPQGAKEVGRAVKPKKLGAVAIDTALSVAFYSVLTDDRRYRLLPEEMKSLDTGLPLNVPHVISEEFGSPVVLRVQNAASGKPKTVKEKAAKFFDKGLLNPKTAPWIKAQDLGLVLLGHTAERVAQLRDSVAADDRFAVVRLSVGLGPTAETLAQCIRARSKD